MKIDIHILLTIFILSLFSVILIEGADDSPSSTEQVDEIYDEIKNAFGPALDDAKEKFGPISSLDLEEFEGAKDAFGPIPSFDEAKEALGPASSSVLDKTKEALGPISPSAIDDAKEALGPASSKAKEALGPASSGVIDKAREKLDLLASWITQSKEDTTEAQNESAPSDEAKEETPPNASPLDPYGVLDGAKQNFDSLLDSITEEKEQISPSLVEEAQKESSPVSSKDIDDAENKMGPISTTGVDAPSPGSTSAPDSSDESDLSKIIDKAKSFITHNKEEISADSPSISVKSSNEDASSLLSAPAPAPVMPSTFKEAKDAIGSYSSKAMNAAKEKFSSISSYLSQNKLQISPEPDVKLHSTSAYFDHDVALAIESTIKQAQANSQLALDEAKTLSSDPNVDTSDARKCVQKCMTNFEFCNEKLTKAMEDLRDRNVEMLTEDVGAVEGEIIACQKCFLEHTKMQSPFKDLEEATIKATRECLNVLDHSG